MKYIILFFCYMQIISLEAETFQIKQHKDIRSEKIIESFIHSLGVSKGIPPDQISCESLLGGFSGTSICRFEVNHKSYVLRLFKPELGYYDGVRQIMTAKLAGEIGIAPKVHFIDPDLKGYIMDYVQGRTIRKTDLESKENLANLALTIKCLHSSKQPFPEARSPLQSFQLSVAKGDRQATPYPTKFREVRKIMEDIGGTLQLNPVPYVPTHLDLNAQNILLKGNDFLLIDWENGGLSDPYFDLSMLPIFLRLDEKETTQFLTTYFGRPPTQFEWDRFIVAQPICLLLRAAVFLSGSGEDRSAEFYDKILKSDDIPKCNEIIQLHEEGKLILPRWKIGLSLMQGGVDLAESKKFKASFHRLQNNVKTRINEDSMENKILKCWFDGFNRRDWTSISEIYSDDALIHGKEGLLRGGQGVVELGKKWVEAIPDAQITPLYTSREENEIIVVHWRAEGRMERSIRDIVATGNKVTFHGLTCFRCDGQKIVEHWASVDYRPLGVR